MPPKGQTAEGHPRQCTATAKKHGTRCVQFAMRGQNVCRFHGGKAPNSLKAAKRRLALAEARKLLGVQEDVEPTEMLLAAVRMSAGDVLSLASVVNDEPKLIPAYERALDRAAKISKIALDAGIAERRVKMAESQATQMMQVLQAGMDAIHLTDDQKAKAKLAMVSEIRRIEARVG